MFSVGLDIHTTHITGCVLNDHGQVHTRWTVLNPQGLLRELQKLPTFRVVYEAGTGYGRYFELLSIVAERVVVVHPGGRYFA